MNEPEGSSLSGPPAELTALAVPLAEATEHQPRARASLVAALRHGASHAYVFQGPRGSGKRQVARAFAAELLVAGAEAGAGAGTGPGRPTADDIRRRALLDPSPHPDLIWVRPEGSQHRVEEIRERVIRLASLRPYEGGSRLFVIEAAEAMREESQNALLKTLEEPPPYAHLILLSESAGGVLPTIRSRCQLVEFTALPPTVVEAGLRDNPDAAGMDAAGLRAAARLAAGDRVRASFLVSPEGRQLRGAAEAFVSATLAPPPGSAADTGDAVPAGVDQVEPWNALLRAAEAVGEQAENAAEARLADSAELGFKLSKTESGQAVRREARRARTEILDLGLELCQIWFRDLAVAAAGAGELIFNADRAASIGAQAARVAPSRARVAAETVADFRRRLELNVSEELALEGLHSRLSRALPG